MNHKRTLVAVLLALLLFFAMTLPASADYDYAANAKVFASDYSGKTVILHTNDVHGRLDAYPAIAAARTAFEKAGAEVILADVGDFSQGTPYVFTTQGAAAVTMMNAAGYDIVALGNHDFDFGYPQLKKNMEAASFKVVCANVFLDASGETIYEPATIYVTKSGLRLGFFGLLTPETATKTNPALTKDVSFGSADELYDGARRAVDMLKEKNADLIIGLTHLGVDQECAALGYRSIDLYDKVDGIDFLIDGHSHTAMTAGENGEPIQSAGGQASNIGVVVIDNAGRKIEDHFLIGIPGFPVDESVAAVEKSITDPVDEEYNAVFAKAEVALNGEKAASRTGQTNLGKLITDAMVWTAASDGGLDAMPEYKGAPVVGITNGGGIRASIPAGDVKKSDINTVFPFGNTVAVVYATGEELLEALEASTYCTPEQLGGYPQTCGMEWTLDTAKAYDQGEPYTLYGKESSYYAPASIRRVSIQTVGGEPFDESATYAVVTNSFCASGGDTYSVFHRAYSQGCGFDTGIGLDEAMMRYITDALGGVIGEEYAAPSGEAKQISSGATKQAPTEEAEEALFSAGIDAIARLSSAAPEEENAGEGSAPKPEKPYTLEQVVVLSRHNLRAPLSSNGSVPSELTPHDWINWSAGSSELTLKGGIEETGMGQYFRKWLAQEGLIPENHIPEEGEVRFNARDKQRCRATARYFAAGMFPLADIAVEYPGDASGTEDFMQPTLKYYSDAFAAAATAQVAELGGSKGFEGLADETRRDIRLVMDTVDMPDSEAYRSGKYGDLLTDGSGYKMEADKEPEVTGAIKTAIQVADALLLQYYEEPDAVKAAFGHELTEEDWAELGGFLTKYLEMRHGTPLVALSITHPLIQELESELKNESRKFSFFCAHDCTVFGTLSALGAEAYTLPDSIETKAPIGVKLLFERWRDNDGQAWYRVSLVYRSTEQIRSGEMLTPDNPPLRCDLRFEGVETNEDGLISEEDLFGLFDRTLTAFDELEAKYPQEEAGKAAAGESTLDSIRERGVLRVGTAGDYRPMSYLDPETDSCVGFDAELAEDLAASLGVEIEYVKTSWPTLMEDTLAGKFDLAICGITITDARREQALMSAGYLGNGKTVLCRAEDAEVYTSLDAINRPEVRVMENPGGLNEKFAREKLPDAELIIHDVNQEIPGLVASGEADVMITEIMEAGYYVGQDSRLAAPLLHEPFTNGQLGVLMPKGSEDLLGYVNGFLKFEKNSGRLEELAWKYIYGSSEEKLDMAA